MHRVSPSRSHRRSSSTGASWLLPWALLLLLGSAWSSRAEADGTWTMAPANTAAGGQAFGLWMLTDGRVLSHGRALNDWVVLTPDRSGDYTKGKWTSVASGPHGRGGAQQHILKDGRFFQAGGEYVDGPACTRQLCVGVEIYDPIADVWKTAADGLYEIADTGSATLPDGRVYSSSRSSKHLQIYDPDADKWIDGGSDFPLNNGDENSWATLQNGGILAVGYKADGGAIYNIAKDKWVRTGPVPSGFDTGDTGGISLMFDGRVLVYGIGQMFIYNPGATADDPGTWDAGPKALMNYEAEDEFSNTMPDGKVWGALVAKTYGPGVILQEFDPDTNTVRSVEPPPDKGNPYPIGYINLPTGQTMVTCEQNDWIYTPDTEPKDEWRPTVSSVEYEGDNKYKLTGTQLSGLINGSDEGDDMTNAMNYPIVWLKNSETGVYYCRSFNFSLMTPAKGDDPQTCEFTTPDDLPPGSYELYVSAVGVRSKTGFPFTVGESSTADPNATNMASAGNGAAGGSAGSGTAGSQAAGAGGSGAAGSSPGSSTTTATSTAGVSTGGAGGSSSTSLTDGTRAGSGANGTSSDNADVASSGKDSGGCGCRVASSSSSSPVSGWLCLGFAGLCVSRVRRRRRQRARRPTAAC